MAWYRLARRQNRSAGETMATTPYTEFLRWLKLDEIEAKERNETRTKDEYYQAQIAYLLAAIDHHIRHFMVERPPPFTTKLETFLFDFVTKKPVAAEKKKPEPPKKSLADLEKDRAAKVALSKSSWLTMVGVTLPGRKVKTQQAPRQGSRKAGVNGNRTSGG